MANELLNRKVVRVPEVSGLGIEKARILMEDAGLGKKLVVLYREGYEDQDTVVDQRPARGQMVYEGTEVTGTPETVLLRGNVLVEGGELVAEPGVGQFVKRARFGQQLTAVETAA